MVFPVVGGDGKPTGYEIDNSLRFNDDDDPYLARTPSSSGSRTKATVSFWVKRGNLAASGNHYILEASSSTSPFNMTRVRFGDDFLIIDNTLNGNAGNGFYFQSTREYRDPSAWYHIFFSVDVTQANATDGWRLYVNGVQQTQALDFWVQNANLEWSQSGVQMNIGRRHDNGTEHLDGYLTEFHYIDGTIKSYTDFGEFNNNGVWIPKKYDGGSYGTNGFYMEFQQTGTSANSSGIGADTSGNDNHFTPNNLAATDITTDTCTNNFATFNPLDNDTITGAASFSEGNLVINANSDAQSGCPTTIAVSNGKWYIEGKCLSSTFEIGVFGYGDGFSFNLANHPPYGDNGYPFAYNYGGNLTINNSNSQTGVGTFTTNDILAIALDMDNNTIKFFKNGSQVGSTITDSNLTTFAPYSFYVANHTGSNTNMFSLNTGNPAFSISSGNSDANGHGNFEYAVPSGYFALCTKNLAEYG